ncbi:COP9 signalosome complex subunit 4 [Cryptococcus deuterogattii MMRL2647]|nr:COP9 signalosome complex subunit 4 [Cryptococcus deuterogattii MMRL2647]
MDISAGLQEASSQQNPKLRSQAYLSLLQCLLQPPLTSASPLIAFGTHFTTSNTVIIIVGRRILGAYLTALLAGTTVVQKGTAKVPLDEEGQADEAEWIALGNAAFNGEKGEEITVLRHLHSHLLMLEEDWEGAARALMPIQLEGGSRLVSDDEKLNVYMQIVRLFLECGEWGQAQTYFTRASLLPRPTDKETRLSMRLSQAKLYDFANDFAKASVTYHEVSHDTSIDPSDRLLILSAAVTTSILAPSGPHRSRILATLNRDDRVHTELPAGLGTMLKKMLLEYIVKPEEMKEFEEALAPHQRAVVEGGGTVLERAVREHNVGACAKVYDNISFSALGAILNLSPSSAETIARRMIEQSRLRAWIDQPSQLIFFESRPQLDTDADAQGTAGGLGVEKEEKEVEKVSWGVRWDERIRGTSLRVEGIAEGILAKGLIGP